MIRVIFDPSERLEVIQPLASAENRCQGIPGCVDIAGRLAQSTTHFPRNQADAVS